MSAPSIPPRKPAALDIDEDVDDLDDVLEQFTPAPSKQPAAPPPSAAKTDAPSARAQVPDDDINDVTSEDFARELAAGMEALMREFSNDAGAGAVPGVAGDNAMSDEVREKELRAIWETIVGDASKEEDPQSKAGASAPGVAPDAVDPAFQESIKRAMEKLKQSDETLQADAAAAPDDSIEALLAQLAGGGEATEELQGVLEAMMTQLMSKEVLYEPLKELHEKLPGYMAEHATTIKPEDKTRWDAQYTILTQVLAIFDDPKYSDEDAEKGKRVVMLMNEMQAHGPPPQEIMGPVPPGLDFGGDGLPKMAEGCPVQ